MATQTLKNILKENFKKKIKEKYLGQIDSEPVWLKCDQNTTFEFLTDNIGLPGIEVKYTPPCPFIAIFFDISFSEPKYFVKTIIKNTIIKYNLQVKLENVVPPEDVGDEEVDNIENNANLLSHAAEELQLYLQRTENKGIGVDNFKKI